MDDLLKRGLVSLGIIFGGLIMIDILMMVSGTKPIGLAGEVFHGIEVLFKMLLWGVVGVAVMIALVVITTMANEKTKELEEEKRRCEQLEKQKIIDAEIDRIEREKRIEKAEEKRLWKEQLAQEEIAKEEYLKTRSASQATKDALNDFL